MKNPYEYFELISESTNERIYRTSCILDEKEESLYLYFNFDIQNQNVNLSFKYNLDFIFETSLFNRIKNAFKILFKRDIKEVPGTTFEFKNRSHLLEFKDLIITTTRELREENDTIQNMQTHINHLEGRLSKYENITGYR